MRTLQEERIKFNGLLLNTTVHTVAALAKVWPTNASHNSGLFNFGQDELD